MPKTQHLSGLRPELVPLKICGSLILQNASIFRKAKGGDVLGFFHRCSGNGNSMNGIKDTKLGLV